MQLIKRYYLVLLSFKFNTKIYIPMKEFYIKTLKNSVYKLLSIKYAFKQFYLSKWEKLNQIEKRIVIQSIENKEAKRQRRKPVRIKVVDTIEEDLYTIVLGKYYYKRNTIELAVRNINPLLILKTYFHEQKHAIQYSLSQSDNNDKVFEKCLSMIEFDDSLSIDNEKKYLLQKLELDANFYSIEKIFQLEDIYSKDDNWNILLKSINIYIENILYLEKMNSKIVKELILYNINKANDVFVISNEEIKMILKKIKFTNINISSSYYYLLNYSKRLMEKYDILDYQQR